MIVTLIRLRFVLLGGALAAVVLLAALGIRIQYDQSIESFFAADDPTVIAYRHASELFGNDQIVFVCYDDPDLLTGPGMDRLAVLAASISGAGIDGVVEVQSLDRAPVFWQLDDALLALERTPKFLRAGALELLKKGLSGSGGGRLQSPTIGRALRDVSEADLTALRDRIRTHPLLAGTLVDGTGTSTAIVVRLAPSGEQDSKLTVGRLRQVADGFAKDHGLGAPAIVGPPVLLADGFQAIERDGQRLAIAGMLLIGLVTLSATRSVWWALVPLVSGWAVWLATEAILGTLDLRLSLSGGPLVAQIIVLTMPAASHLALHFREARRSMSDRREAAERTLRSVSGPILWCALAATIGYGALLTSNVVPIRQFGAVLAVATAAASLLTLGLSVSAMLPPFRLEIPVRHGSSSRSSKAMNRVTAWVERHPVVVVAGTLAAVLPMLAGMPRLEYESNYINAFRGDSRVVRDYQRVESRLGGIGLVGLVLPLPGGIDSKAVRDLRDLDRAIEDGRRAGTEAAVDRVLSLAQVLDPDDRLNGLDEDRQSWFIQTKLDLIQASPQAGLLKGFWNAEEGRARSLLRISERQAASAKEAAFAGALSLARERFGADAELTGLSKLLTETTRGVVETQWTTFTWAALGILLTLTLAFRGPKLAVLAILPTMLAVGLVLGLMGWLGLKLDIATALVASVALGLSVDDTFHCLLNFRRLRKKLPFREALLESYQVSGPGVVLSSLAVAVGFAVLRLSEFVPFATFGAMVCIATAGSSLGNLLLLPACLSLADRLSSRHRATIEPAG